MGTSSPAMLCSMWSVAMAKGLCRSYGPGEQDTSCPGRGEPQLHAYLPWMSVQDRAALDGKSPFTAVSVPWSLHSAVVPLCCLPHLFFCKEQAAELPPPAPWCPARTVLGAVDRGLMAICVLQPESSLESCGPLWAPGSEAKCKLYLFFPGEGPY